MQVLLGLGLAGTASIAHALCVNPDGSLNDPSVPPGMVSLEMLPACHTSAAPGAEQQAVSTAAETQATYSTTRHLIRGKQTH